MVRGNADELIEFCYFVYDMNGDRSLAREELWQCLKGCIYPGTYLPSTVSVIPKLVSWLKSEQYLYNKFRYIHIHRLWSGR